VQDIGERLDAEGIIELRIESNVPRDDMPELVRSCDVLIDGLVLGLYGTTSVEGMASGRIVLANLSRVLHRQPEEPPAIHVAPDTLEKTLREISSNPNEYRRQAEQGPEYVRRYHDGRFAAQQLDEFLDT
jgi:hypothetical protein